MSTLRRWHGALLLSITVGLLVGVGSAQADNVFPPSWANDPTTFFAEWDMTPPGGAPQLTSHGFGADPDGPTGPIMPFSQPPIGTQTTGGYTFQIPNWIDDFMLKCMRIQITYSNAMGGTMNPLVDDVMAFDPMFGPGPGPNVPPGNITQKAISTRTEIPDMPGMFIHVEDWQIIPNPDWEQFNVNVAGDVLVKQVFVHTISIPEPAPVLFGGLVCGVIGLSWVGRRVLRVVWH
jgi:hypothetical protein